MMNKEGVPGASENPVSRAVSTGDEPIQPRSSRLPRVTGIRHWSTPDYTRIAIDVEGDVKFSSQRIATPARIFFDLNGTKLASTLVGKSFDVDDGFLKKVRVAPVCSGPHSGGARSRQSFRLRCFPAAESLSPDY